MLNIYKSITFHIRLLNHLRGSCVFYYSTVGFTYGYFCLALFRADNHVLLSLLSLIYSPNGVPFILLKSFIYKELSLFFFYAFIRPTGFHPAKIYRITSALKSGLNKLARQKDLLAFPPTYTGVWHTQYVAQAFRLQLLPKHRGASVYC